MTVAVALPPAFVEFMRDVVDLLDSDEEDDRALVEVSDGLQCEQGYGGQPAADSVAGRRMLAALIERGALRLVATAKTDAIAEWLERLVYQTLDAPGLSDAERAQQLAEALLDNASIDEVFADDAELLRLVHELDDR